MHPIQTEEAYSAPQVLKIMIWKPHRPIWLY